MATVCPPERKAGTPVFDQGCCTYDEPKLTDLLLPNSKMGAIAVSKPTAGTKNSSDVSKDFNPAAAPFQAKAKPPKPELNNEPKNMHRVPVPGGNSLVPASPVTKATPNQADKQKTEQKRLQQQVELKKQFATKASLKTQASQQQMQKKKKEQVAAANVQEGIKSKNQEQEAELKKRLTRKFNQSARSIKR